MNQNTMNQKQTQNQTQTRLKQLKFSTFGAFGNEPKGHNDNISVNVNMNDNINHAASTNNTNVSNNADSAAIMGDEELVNVVWKKPHQRVIMPSSGLGLGGKGIKVNNVNVDLSKEYGYQYEYTEEGEDELDSDESDSSDSDDSNNSTSDKNGNHQNANEQSTFLSKIISTINDNNNNNNNDPNDISYSIHLLGKTYHPITDYALRRDYETNLFWFSYRCDFTPILPQNLTTDAGWGCMLRSAQMLLCQALRMHYCGRDWTSPKSMIHKRQHVFVQDVLMWMADYPSGCTTGCWYSLHNMVAAGVSRYDVLPGEWFGPGTACYVLRDLVELHSRDWERRYRNQNEKDTENGRNHSRVPLQSQSQTQTNSSSQLYYQRHSQPVMRVHVASEGSIYHSEIEQLMTKDQDQNRSKSSTDNDNTRNGVDTNGDHDDDGYDKVDFDALVSDPLLHPLADTQHNHNQPNKTSSDNKNHPQSQTPNLHLPQWDDTSLLILIPLRLGLKTFQSSSYAKPLAHILSFPQSVGFVGGAPRHALWFYGATSDGGKVYGLDPHTVQRAPRRRRLRVEEEARTAYSGSSDGAHRSSGGSNSHTNTQTNTNTHPTKTHTKQYQVQLTDEYLRSVNCPNISTMDMSRIDPSLALGFYCRDRQDYESFCALVEEMKSVNHIKDCPALFSIADCKPDYNADLSMAMMDMMLGGGGDGGGSSSQFVDDDDGNYGCGGGVGGDDDDFVML